MSTLYTLEQHISQFDEHDIVRNDNEIFEAKACDLYTDIGNFQFFMSYNSLKKEIEKGWVFKYKKLDEKSAFQEHFTELILDIDSIKILWYREHSVVIDKVEFNKLQVWPEQL